MKRWLKLLTTLLIVLLVGGGAFFLGRFFERYIGFAPVSLPHPKTVQEQEIKTLPLSSADRLYGLSLVWEKAKYNFPFFQQRPGLNWDAAYRETIDEALAAPDDLAYYRVLQRFAARLHDGHTRVRLPAALEDQLDRPPVWLEVYNHELYISHWLDATPETDRSLGARLLEIDGRSAAEQIASLQPALSASTPQDLWARTADELLLGPAGSEVTLKVEQLNGKVSLLTLQRNRRELLSGRAQTTANVTTRDLGDGLRYLRIASFADQNVVEQFNQALPDFRGIKGLVIDVRSNGGGNSGYGDRIFSRLIRFPVRNVNWLSRQRVAFADAAKMGELWFYGPPGIITPSSLTRGYSGPVVVLTNARTYSAAENFTALFQMSGRGKIIGQATGGSTGQPIFFPLPGGGTGAVVTKWDVYPDGREFVGVGILPEIEVIPTPADFASQRDPALEKALEVLRGD